MPKSTKNQIMTTLAELLRAKRLDDITVTELVENCGISRQAFREFLSLCRYSQT